MNQANLWSSMYCWKKKKFSLQVNCLSGVRDIRSNFMSRIINYDLWNFNSCLLRSSYRSRDQSNSKALLLTWLSRSLESLGGFRICMCNFIPIAGDVLKASSTQHKRTNMYLEVGMCACSASSKFHLPNYDDRITTLVSYITIWLRVLLFFLNYNLEKARCSWKINQCELTCIYPRSVIQEEHALGRRT